MANKGKTKKPTGGLARRGITNRLVMEMRFNRVPWVTHTADLSDELPEDELGAAITVGLQKAVQQGYNVCAGDWTINFRRANDPKRRMGDA